MRTIRRWKNDEEIKTWEMFTFESRYFKKKWQDEKRTERLKIVQKEGEKTKRWGNDETMIYNLIQTIRIAVQAWISLCVTVQSPWLDVE